MFDDNKSCFSLKLFHKIDGGVNINEVVIRKFFAIELFEQAVKIAIISSLLMWVFSVP